MCNTENVFISEEVTSLLPSHSAGLIVVACAIQEAVSPKV